MPSMFRSIAMDLGDKIPSLKGLILMQRDLHLPSKYCEEKKLDAVIMSIMEGPI